MSAEEFDAFIQVIAQIIVEDLQRTGGSAILKKDDIVEAEDQP